MNDRDDLARLLEQHPAYSTGNDQKDWFKAREAADAIIAAGWVPSEEVKHLRDDLDAVSGGVEAICHEGHRIFIDDGEGTVYACPACALELARSRLDTIRSLADETLRKLGSSSAPWAVSLARSIKRVLDRPGPVGRNPWTMRNSPSGRFLAAKAAGDVFKGARRED